ncbi:MAG TPA: thioredoxin-dependent thiol peroxidase [Longimicrobiales bacterium]|nr:thioredoxin-dependent thiol peroxidase [Longimicrobiales bacterium]
MVSENQPAPDFELQADDGSAVKLSNFKGQKVILYFYPKDDTPGCTTQACDLRDHIQEIDARGVVVLGVSPDDVASHRKFKQKFGLNFPLLADVDHTVAELYGVWKEKNLYGRKIMGVERTSFIIDEEGNIAKVLPRVKPAEHVGQLLELV